MTRLEAAIAELAAAIAEDVSARNAPPAPDRLLDADEAGAVLGVSRTTVYQEMAAGRLQSIKVGRLRRIPSSAIARYIADGAHA